MYEHLKIKYRHITGKNVSLDKLNNSKRIFLPHLKTRENFEINEKKLSL